MNKLFAWHWPFNLLRTDDAAWGGYCWDSNIQGGWGGGAPMWKQALCSQLGIWTYRPSDIAAMFFNPWTASACSSLYICKGVRSCIRKWIKFNSCLMLLVRWLYPFIYKSHPCKLKFQVQGQHLQSIHILLILVNRLTAHKYVNYVQIECN